MENLHDCPYGTVTIGEKTLRLCEKRGCRLEGELIGQAQEGGHSLDDTTNGPYWPEANWKAYCERVEAIIAEDKCAIGQAVLAQIAQYTQEKRDAEPPQLR